MRQEGRNDGLCTEDPATTVGNLGPILQEIHQNSMEHESLGSLTTCLFV